VVDEIAQRRPGPAEKTVLGGGTLVAQVLAQYEDQGNRTKQKSHVLLSFHSRLLTGEICSNGNVDT